VGLTDSIDFVRRRYDRLAPIYRLIELLFQLPPRIRRRAVEALAVRQGDRVLEVGCGSGRNLDLLTAAVGPSGWVTGIDVSAGMLGRAHRLVARRRWGNVTLAQQDAALLDPAGRVDAVLFSLSYSVIPDRRAALARAWAALRDGGRLVIMDACLPEGSRGRLLQPFARALSRATVLGDPGVRPWEELVEIAGRVEGRRLHHGTYAITRARKRSGG
jgi:demethylmenaquinone methyltransferase/2-methoxy-6-polyprenyl-1,4-benzoquinol methylase